MSEESACAGVCRCVRLCVGEGGCVRELSVGASMCSSVLCNLMDAS